MRKKIQFVFDGGYYGELRGQFLKKNHPKIFQALEESGELHDYLEGYQKAYALKYDKLMDKLAKQKGIDPALYELDFGAWMRAYYQLNNEVQAIIKKEIETL